MSKIYDKLLILLIFSLSLSRVEGSGKKASAAETVEVVRLAELMRDVLDVYPKSIFQVPVDIQGETSLSSVYTPSDSLWGEGLDEEMVFKYEIKHIQDEHNSYTLRIGKGGQIYSLRGAFGESVPPQGKGNPWNDEVWQFVTVCSKYNGLNAITKPGSVPTEVVDRYKKSPYKNSFFIHNSGAYIPAAPIDSGEITVSFDVMLNEVDPGLMHFTLRDYTNSPPVSFGDVSVGNGAIKCRNKTIAKIENGLWYTIEMRFNLGEKRDGQINVNVKDENGVTQSKLISYADKPFSTLSWMGVFANSDKGKFNVDNLLIKRKRGENNTTIFNKGFEEYNANESFPGAQGVQPTAGSRVFITDKVFASGKHSLEFHDAKRKHGHQPALTIGLSDDSDKELTNLYCPLLGSSISSDNKSIQTVNWGLVPQVKTIHRSPILYYVKTRDVGDGVIEITYVVHNFSALEEVVFDWLNAPWGGTRMTNLPFHYLSSPENELWSREVIKEKKIMNGIDVRKTGGWNLSCASEEPDSPSLALVFGRDRHLESELLKVKEGKPYCQYDNSIYRDWPAHAPEGWRNIRENAFRNYEVAVVIPKFRLAPGTTIWYRSFIVVNEKDRAIELAKSLVDEVDYGLRVFDPTSTPMVPVYIRNGKVFASGNGQPNFELFSKPVPKTMPVFLIENESTGREVLTTDPYLFVPKEKLDYGLPKNHPHENFYSKMAGLSMDENNSNWKRILGYGYVDKPESGDWKEISSRLDRKQFPDVDIWHLDLWVK